MIPIRGLREPVEVAAPVNQPHARRAAFRRVVEWSPAKDALLRQMWEAGRTGTEIAAAIGCGATKNAVIGRAHRLGVKRRPNPAEEVRRGAE